MFTLNTINTLISPSRTLYVMCFRISGLIIPEIKKRIVLMLKSCELLVAEWDLVGGDVALVQLFVFTENTEPIECSGMSTQYIVL